MKGINRIPKILKINNISGYKISCLFSTGESRIIDIKELLLERIGITKKHPASKLLKDKSLFQEVKILGNSIGWTQVGIDTKNEEGKNVFYPFELDPIVLYQNSEIDEIEMLNVGLLIKNERLRLGLTQEELGKKIGSSKHYISRLENNKSDIEFLTLVKIIKAGFGKNLEIKIVEP